MSEGILVFIEQRDGALNRTSLEAIVAAQGVASETGQKISAVVLGIGISNVASEIAGRKLDIVYTVEDEKLGEYTPDGYVAALKQIGLNQTTGTDFRGVDQPTSRAGRPRHRRTLRHFLLTATSSRA